jgi:ribosomal protein L11 methylase PrmA
MERLGQPKGRQASSPFLITSTDLQHQLWLLTLHDELSLAPVKNPKNVLDIGTGTGIWAIEVCILSSSNFFV